MSDQSPFELYREIEARLNPLLVACLEKHLPTVGDDWWDSCVIKAFLKNSVVNEFLHTKKSLSDFDFPALVNICYYNKKVLRVALGVGDELSNYLFTIKTFRNDVVHNPNLVLDPKRVRILTDSARMAEQILLRHKPITFAPNQKNDLGSMKPVFVLGLVLLAALATYYFTKTSLTKEQTIEEIMVSEQAKIVDTKETLHGFAVGFNRQVSRHAKFPIDAHPLYTIESLSAHTTEPKIQTTLSLKNNDVLTSAIKRKIVESQMDFVCPIIKDLKKSENISISVDFTVLYKNWEVYKDTSIKPWTFRLTESDCQ